LQVNLTYIDLKIQIIFNKYYHDKFTKPFYLAKLGKEAQNHGKMFAFSRVLRRGKKQTFTKPFYLTKLGKEEQNYGKCLLFVLFFPSFAKGEKEHLQSIKFNSTFMHKKNITPKS
jgi:hypothetical protein